MLSLRRLLLPLVACGLVSAADLSHAQDSSPFRRGDANADGRRDISDAVHSLSYLFRGGPESTCQDAADTNDDGSIDVSDSVWLIWFLFAGAAPPPAPGGICGNDPTFDALDCQLYSTCAGEDFNDFVSRIIREESPSSEPISINDRIFVFRNEDDAFAELFAP